MAPFRYGVGANLEALQTVKVIPGIPHPLLLLYSRYNRTSPPLSRGLVIFIQLHNDYQHCGAPICHPHGRA